MDNFKRSNYTLIYNKIAAVARHAVFYEERFVFNKEKGYLTFEDGQ